MTLTQPPKQVFALTNGQQVQLAGSYARGMARSIDSGIHATLGITGVLLISSAMFCASCTYHETDRQMLHIGIYMLAGWVLYEPVTVAWRGQTLGKAICGVKTVRIADGETPHLGQTFVRWVIPAAVGVVLSSGAVRILLSDGQIPDSGAGRGFGLLAVIIMWTPVYLSSFLDNGVGRRGWHDKAAGTVVVKVPRRVPLIGVGGPGAGDAVSRGSTTSGPATMRPSDVARDVSHDDPDRWDVRISATAASSISKRSRRLQLAPETPKRYSSSTTSCETETRP